MEACALGCVSLEGVCVFHNPRNVRCLLVSAMAEKQPNAVSSHTYLHRRFAADKISLGSWRSGDLDCQADGVSYAEVMNNGSQEQNVMWFDCAGHGGTAEDETVPQVEEANTRPSHSGRHAT